jgi:hypothetical protein
LLAAAIVAIAWALLSPRHQGGDPSGVRGRALQSLKDAVPVGTETQISEYAAPSWQTCGGTASGDGWTDAQADYQFTTSLPPQQVVAMVKAKLTAISWREGTTRNTPLGPVVTWTRVLAPGVEARAQLGITQASAGHRYWELVGSAPPAGQRLSGC